jgi:hypothetical protein
MAGLLIKYGKLLVASCAVMIVGVTVFFLAIPLYIYSGIDLDVLGFFIFIIGLAIFIIGIIKKWKLRGWKLIAMSFIVAWLLLATIIPFVISIIYFIFKGEPLGG